VPTRPPALALGDPIAVVAPASPPRDLSRYRAGLSQLRDDYDVRFAWAPGNERGFLAARDRARTDALHRAICTTDIRAIFCVRGGYGSLRLLDQLNWPLIREHPTLLVGYSDVTALHLALYARAGWTGLSGPVVTEWPVLPDETRAHVRAWTEGRTPLLGSDLTTLQSGTATGPLLGGNLSVLTRLLGTPYAPTFRGAILCLEDVAEAPYRVDRMLSHLQHAGVLQTLSGAVLGHFTTGDDSMQQSLSLKTVFGDYFADRPYPVATGLRYGHRLPRTSLPIGTPVGLDASASGAELTALTPVVSTDDTRSQSSSAADT